MKRNKLFMALGIVGGGAAEPIYTLRDDFTDTVAAGSVHGTNATPTGGVRTVVDTNSKLSLGLGVAGFATGGAAAANPGIWYSQVTRVAGKTLVVKLAGTNTRYLTGWDTNQTGGLIWGVGFNSTAGGIRIGTYSGSPVVVAALPTSNAVCYVAHVLRAAGVLHFVKEATAYPNWTLLWADTGGTENPYPAAQVETTTTVFSVDFMRIPESVVTITPLASDAFTRSNGALGNTGGGASSEAGGSGLAWTDQQGTWAIATNKATSSALDGGTSQSIATVNAGAANVLAECVITRSAGSMGFVLRWTDADNYIKALYDGTNWTVIEVVAGTPNTILSATAATYGGTKRTIVSLIDTKMRLFYGDAAVGAELTTAVTTGTNHGLITTDTGATFDNFIVWNKAGGAYDSALNNFLA